MTATNAIVVQRVDSGTPATDEIRALAAAAGYTIVDEVTQVRAEDPGTHLGQGKVEQLADRVAKTGAEIAIVDGELTPAQNHGIRAALPDGTRVHDRYRLVLDVFGDQAGTRRAQLQVELARLRYELPRMRESADEGWFNKRVEKGSPLYDAEDRIDRLETKLDELPDPAAEFRKRRREEGFDLVTIAGYTNAGKSTLLHRLADELTLADIEPDHADRDATAAVEDRLFKTLETTTRRATLGGRPVLLTDTVGFVADLPHWLVESFSATLSEAAAADRVVLVADSSDPPDELREKLRVSLDVLDAQDVPREAVVTALNKVDLLNDEERERRLAAAADIAPSPLPISVREGTNLDRLVARIEDELPTERTTVEMENVDEAMSVVSWLYDHANVADVSYGSAGDQVTVTFAARPSIVEQARAKAAAVGGVDG
ncbi:HflX GTPase family protein [Halococcus saccharolyticus]|uniref:GTPase HflX n=1 Tax=Halococcus saccharolyticus DSM 5350 TaxID=1227455 RepID=M0MNP5_9EURY|nr:GTPase HflX [Halococcus saccharolyticus]EMA47286.1 GTP-binding proten HflX [Halococcus saccharolyticus DSM 5350]